MKTGRWSRIPYFCTAFSMTRKVWSAAACSEHVHVYLQIDRPVFVERSIQHRVRNLLTTHKRALFPWWIGRKWLCHPAGVRAAIKPEFYATKAHPVDMAYIKIRPPRQQLERSWFSRESRGISRLERAVGKC
jgi:hypothetical protein